MRRRSTQRSVIDVVSTRKKRHDNALSTLRKVFMLREMPLLNIDHVAQGSWISIRGVPEPKNRAKRRQLRRSIYVG